MLTDADLDQAELLVEACAEDTHASNVQRMLLQRVIAEARAARRYREALTTIQKLAEDELRRFVPKGNVPQIEANARAALAGDQKCRST